MLRTIELHKCPNCLTTFGTVRKGAKPRRYGHVVQVHRQLTWRPGETELVIESNNGDGGVQTITVKTRCDCKELTRA